MLSSRVESLSSSSGLISQMMSPLIGKTSLLVWAVLLLSSYPTTHTVCAFTIQSQATLLTPHRNDGNFRCSQTLSYLNVQDGPQEGGKDDDNQSIPAGDDEGPIFSEATVKIDDGGSDLNDRFKYKVNALMGTYDPQNTEIDNESHNGNILNAMLNFPTDYTFNIVGKTSGSGGS